MFSDVVRSCSSAVPREKRAGSVSVEFLCFVPLLVGVVVVGLELSLMVGVEQQLGAAATQGARVAAQGGDEQEVELAVRKVLGKGPVGGAKITTNLAANLWSGDPVEVIVTIDAVDVIPDLGVIIGFSVEGMKLGGRAVLRKE